MKNGVGIVRIQAANFRLAYLKLETFGGTLWNSFFRNTSGNKKRLSVKAPFISG